MRIAFYAPFKPLDHPNPSGDRIIGRSLFVWLQGQGHQVRVISRLRTRWIFHHPLKMAVSVFEQRRVLAELQKNPVDCWFTHHCYYKAPDLLGPYIRTNLRTPYVLFQPSYATKYRKIPVTAPGFYLNRRALLAADCCLTNRRQDMGDLRRIVDREKLFFVPPAVSLQRFSRSEEARARLRRAWRAGDRPVILSAAMFRDDVKSLGLARVLESCARLQARGENFVLVIAGDGCQRGRLERLAQRLPADRVRFVGRLQPEQMRDFYSAGDLFVFPGINESLGMVYLEAQACGLPVVAYANGGIGGVVEQGKTGFLTGLDDDADFDAAILQLLQDTPLRQRMGRAATASVQTRHDQGKNYRQIEQILQQLVGEK